MGQSGLIEPRVIETLTSPDVNQHIPTVRVTSDLVLILVNVADQHDNFMVGLERDHFRLYEDNVEQVIAHVSMEDAAVSVGFVFDASGSMAGKIWKSKEAVARFLKTANPDDEFFLVQFNSHVELVLDMTQDTEQLKSKLMRVPPGGQTALFDAVNGPDGLAKIQKDSVSAQEQNSLSESATTRPGDAVAVNGQPAKGLFAARDRWIAAYPVPAPGQAIADVRRGRIREFTFEILQSDGTPVGSIMGMGLAEGDPPPGQPSTEKANWAIVGGTGAFLGARGQVEGTGGTGRAASMAEDPANRRQNGGNPNRYLVHIIPMTVPQIVTTANGPAITHSSDFSLVTASKPAAAGEILSLFATGLGPVRSAVSGQPLPSNPAATVNSPVQVIVNGNPAQLIGAVGYPGAVDGYQVNFRVPAGIATGPAMIQVSAAWTPSAPVTIPIQ